MTITNGVATARHNIELSKQTEWKNNNNLTNKKNITKSKSRSMEMAEENDEVQKVQATKPTS